MSSNLQGTQTVNHGASTEARPTHIVGVGASAGGLEALERFFEQVPAETGLAFVVVQHLSPDFKSLMDELLARRARIPVHRVEDGMHVAPNAIYVIPPRKDMILSGDRLLLTDKDPAQTMSLPIDHFFRSLAHELGDRVVAIVLSGTGSDGSRGIRDVHEAGGLVIAQDPESARFDGMPRSAINTNTVDLVLPPDEMPAALLRAIHHPLWSETGRPGGEEELPLQGMEAIFRLLRESYALDFAYYKPNTVTRRTERRLQMNRINNLEEYVARLRNDPEELNSLYHDLLIGVTRFFRDQEAFTRLKQEVFPGLLAGLPRDEELRIWVAGCASGEEAYSLAITLCELFEEQGRTPNVKIFATDVHRASLEIASAGIYDESCLADVGKARLDRFFVRKEDQYQVIPELRRMIVFAPHNIIKDAPFTRLDFISCRNLLIYLQPAAQKKAISLFLFGLKTGGILMLGPSESPGDLADELTSIDEHWKIYRKRRTLRLPPDVRQSLVGVSGPMPRPRSAPHTTHGMATEHPMTGTYDALLEAVMPPALLLNENRELIQTFGGASRFLRLKDGRISTDVLELVEPELRIVLAAAIQRCAAEQGPITFRGLRTTDPNGERILNLSIRPLMNRRTSACYTLVTFEDIRVSQPLADTVQDVDVGQVSRDRLQTLETELRYTRESLQATIEELETSNEELQATNEELVSSNEELHSVNEELFTVNAEYQKKIAELTELTSDMDNLLASTEVHTLFLDRQRHIRRFTPRMAEVFNLMPQDIGRRVDNFTNNIHFPRLLEVIAEVLNSGSPFEEPVTDTRGHHFLLRVLPYRGIEAIEGIVLTLIDISGLKRAQEEARTKDEQLSGILRHSPHLVFIRDPQGRYVLTDDSFKELIGREVVGKTMRDLFPEDTAVTMEAIDRRVLEQGETVEAEVMLMIRDGSRELERTYLTVQFPVRDAANNVIGVGGVLTDVTRLKQAEREAREAVVQRDRFLAMLSHELRNPLAAIVNAVPLLECVEDTQERLSWVDVIKRRARHMSRLLDDLLDVARVTQNKVVIRKQPIELASVVDDVVEEARAWMDERGIDLNVHRPTAPLMVEGDPARLVQMQVNLLMNAARYTPSGGKVWYSLTREGDQAVIQVRDNGIGIPTHMLERVFDLFVQAHGRDAAPTNGMLPQSGLGIGLTLVRMIAELHGGSVQATSEGPGKGSELTIRLPLSLHSQPISAQVANDTPSDHPSSRSILVVEDDKDNREALVALLRMEGHTVRSAGNGKQALLVFDEQVPDVALLDVGLPDMSGYELARKMRNRQDGKQPMIVALTGFGQATDRVQALEAGFDEHLTKPVNVDDVLALINRPEKSG